MFNIVAPKFGYKPGELHEITFITKQNFKSANEMDFWSVIFVERQPEPIPIVKPSFGELLSELLRLVV